MLSSHRRAAPAPSIEAHQRIRHVLPPLLETFGDILRRSTHDNITSLYPDQGSSLKRRDVSSRCVNKGYTGNTPTDYSHEFVALQQKSFSFKSAADIHCDSLKARLDCRPMRDRLSPHSKPDDMIDTHSRQAASANLHVQLPIHSREPSLPEARESSFLNYRHHNLYTRGGSVLDVSSQRTGVLRNNNAKTNPVEGTCHYFTTGETGKRERSSQKCMSVLTDPCSAEYHKLKVPCLPDENASHAPAGLTNVIRRREGAGCTFPTPHDTTESRGFSISSTSAAPSSAISSHLFPASRSPTISVNPGSYSFSSRASLPGRALASSSIRRVPEPAMPGIRKRDEFYICDCCPMRPKEFDCAEKLAVHQAEKQYECNFCGNRFKNNNEAKRHKSSVHVQRRSMSCSALCGYERAFFGSTNHPGVADVCGYCGDEFARTGENLSTSVLGGGVTPRRTTDQDWNARIRHLKEAHKFRECNSSKKFYRADHFRQHLRLCHAITSGKWTNLLEAACLMD